MDWEPLFPFGYGLSYTSFSYSNLRVVPERIGIGDAVKVLVDVANVGDRDGEEVVQLYIRDLWSSVVRPHKELKRFKRVHIGARQSVEVSFTLGPDDFKLLNRDFEWVVEPGGFEIMVGPHSGALDLRADLEVQRC
jgi:beta-glucosidase